MIYHPITLYCKVAVIWNRNTYIYIYGGMIEMVSKWTEGLIPDDMNNTIHFTPTGFKRIHEKPSR